MILDLWFGLTVDILAPWHDFPSLGAPALEDRLHFFWPVVLVIHCYWTNCSSIQKLKAMTFLFSLLCGRPGNQAHVVGWLWRKIPHKRYIIRLGTHMQALPARYLPSHWLSGAAGRIYSYVQWMQGFDSLSKGLMKVACLWKPSLSRRKE